MMKAYLEVIELKAQDVVTASDSSEVTPPCDDNSTPIQCDLD